MGKYDSDDDRRKSRKKKRSRSRSRGRRSSRERRHSSRSRSRSHERRREKHRESTGRHRRRSTSKSRRGNRSNSRSRSRGRSRGRRSRSRSVDKERRRQKEYTRSKMSKSSSDKKKPAKEDHAGDNDLAIKHSTPCIPSADVLAKFESNSFSSEAFISQRLEKDGNDDTSHQEQGHEDAIFGMSCTKKTTVHKPIEIPRETREEESGIMASLLHEEEANKNDRWLKKLHSMRQKKLLNNS